MTLSRFAALRYVAPFGAFVALLEILQLIRLPDVAGQIVMIVAPGLVLAALSRPVLEFRVKHVAASVLLGALVFAVWIGPDLLFRGYRNYWLFNNPVVGAAQSGLSAAARSTSGIIWLRAARAVLLVPVIEELFWRAWLMRWLIRPDVGAVALGTYSTRAFWLVAVLFASEHGPYWDVGLAAGILYNWWMVKSQSLGDLILAHSVTNACLSAYVIAAGRWEYWL